MSESYMTFTEYCTQLYRSKMDEKAILEQFKEKTGSKLETLNHHYAYAIWYILNTEPGVHFNSSVRRTTVEQLGNKPVTAEVLEYFHTAFKNYRQLTEMMQDFADAGFNPKSKNKLYRVPTYTTLVDDCLTPLFKASALLLGHSADANLTELCELLKQNRLGSFTNKIDPSIIEAIHQGSFTSYSEGKLLGFNALNDDVMLLKSFSCQEFDELIDTLYDTGSGILLGLAQVLSQAKAHLTIEELESNIRVAFDEIALKLSLPNIACIGLNDTSLQQAQINITMKVTESDPNFLICTALEIATQVFEIYPGYHRYLVNFEHDRLATAFVRIKAEEIAEFLKDYTQLSDYIEKMISRGDIQISNPSTEDIDLKEIAAHQYPTLKTDTYHIHSIENVSSKNRKRLKANLFIGDAESKAEIQHKIKEAINWLKQIETAPLSKTETKNGTMEADSIYLNVYRHDKRQDKTINSANENFVCFIEDNIDGRSTIKNGGLPDAAWNQLYKEQDGFLTIAWREQKYHTNKASKVGRNDPCPCGSGKKYKKCHGK